MLRRNPAQKTCHFCNNIVSVAHNGDFQCPTCGSWNMFDAKGKLMSYHPAMHDEALNTHSFSKRASPNRSRLPSSFAMNVFCHTCQTNQTLIMNLLSNYLPPSSDSSYSKRLAEFPAYKESLYARYPPVCANCQPAVDEQIQQKNSMARSAALGGWLQASTRRSISPGAGSGVRDKKPLRIGLHHDILWNVRGVLWLVMAVWWIYTGIAGSLTHPQPPPLVPYPNFLIHLISVLWQFWDPTWKTLQRTQLQGHEARVDGKTMWLRCQGLVWIVRVVLAATIALRSTTLPRSVFAVITLFELLVNVIAFRSLRIVRPPRIRLVASSRNSNHTPAHGTEPRTTAPSASNIQHPADVPALSALSLSSFPTSRPTRAVNPIFGVTSLPQSQSQPSPPAHTEYDDPGASDTMDWTPTTGYTREETANLLRPARFAPEKPTGLEGLIEKFGISGDESEERTTNSPPNNGQGGSGMEKGMVIGVLVGLCFAAAVTAMVILWPQGLANQPNNVQVLIPQQIADDL